MPPTRPTSTRPSPTSPCSARGADPSLGPSLAPSLGPSLGPSPPRPCSASTPRPRAPSSVGTLSSASEPIVRIYASPQSPGICHKVSGPPPCDLVTQPAALRPLSLDATPCEGLWLGSSGTGFFGCSCLPKAVTGVSQPGAGLESTYSGPRVELRPPVHPPPVFRANLVLVGAVHPGGGGSQRRHGYRAGDCSAEGGTRLGCVRGALGSRDATLLSYPRCGSSAFRFVVTFSR